MSIYSSNTTRVPVIWSVVLTFTILAAVCVFSRIYVRWKKRGRLRGDDYMVILSMGLSFGYSLDLLLQINHGFGRHFPKNATAGEYLVLASFLQNFLAAEILYYLTAGITQISFLLYYLRRYGKNVSHAATYASEAYVVAVTIMAVIGTAFQCQPTSSWWNSSTSGRCMKTDAFFLATGAFHILANLIVFALPLKITIKNTSGGGLREKLGVGLVLGTGLAIIVCSFLRLQRLKGPDNSVDPTWNNVPHSLWSTAEVNLALIAISLPYIPSFFHFSPVSRILPRSLTPSGPHRGTVELTGGTIERAPSSMRKHSIPRHSVRFDLESNRSNSVVSCHPSSNACTPLRPPSGPYGHNDNISNYEAKVMGNVISSINESKENMVKETEESVNVAVVKTTSVTISREDAPKIMEQGNRE